MTIESQFGPREQLALLQKRVKRLELALVAARRAADAEHTAAQLARASAATAWRLSMTMRKGDSHGNA